MKSISKKITLITLLILCFQTVLFSEEKKTSIELGKEVAQLKFELFKIENKIGEYKDVPDFKLSFIEAKKERLLRKRNKELLDSVNDDKEAAKNILDKAAKDIISKAKELKDFGKDFLEYIRKYFEEEN